MSASTQIAVQLSVQASARRERCRIVLDGYDAKSASVEQMREYAACVQSFHPAKQFGAGDVLASVVAIVAVALSIYFVLYCLSNK